MSRILHLINMGLRYGRSKGVRAHRLEELPWTNLTAPCHLEESASHHILSYRQKQLWALPLVDGGGCEALWALPLVEGGGCEALSSR